MNVDVLIPWYDQPGVDDRKRVLEFVLNWWHKRHPRWNVIVGSMGSDEGPWRKGLAVRRALQKSSSEIVVVADADVVCDGVEQACDEVQALRTGWAVPHRLVYRMTEDATGMLIGDGRYPPLVAPGVVSPDFGEIYSGKAGGGLVVLPRLMLDEVPIDARFAGWGQEDLSWGRALTMIGGHPWRGLAPLLHLWHQPQDRISRGVGSVDNYDLWQQYQQCGNMPAMLDLVDHAREYVEKLAALPAHGV